MNNYNRGEIIQPKLSNGQAKELREACTHFKESYPAMLARPRMALEIIADFKRATQSKGVTR